MNDNKKNKNKNVRFSWGKPSVMQDIVLALGLVLILIGILLSVKASSHALKDFAFRPFIILLVGIVMLYLGVAVTRNDRFLFLGILFVLQGIVFLLKDTGIIHFRFREIWPTLMISCGIALFPAGLYRVKRIRAIYLFPAIMLVLFGGAFLLFSMHVFPFTFVQFIVKWWPLFIVLTGVLLVAVFFVQQTNLEQFPYMEDDSLVDSGEDL